MMNINVNKKNFCDRFIPRRNGADVEVLNYMLTKDSTLESIESDTSYGEGKRFKNNAYVRWQRKMFQERLWSQTFIPKKMLNFSQPHQMSRKSSVSCKLWPVRARTKPLIGSPSTVLDMPSLAGEICQQTTDWGSTGYLASVFAGEVFLWYPQTHDSKVVTSTGGNVGKCIRWNRKGTEFAMSVNGKGFAIFNLAQNKVVREASCSCAFMCTITAMEWTKSNFLITGCTFGRIAVWNKELKYVDARYCAHDGMVIEIRLSFSEKYVATSGEDNNVRIWLWPSLKEHFQVSYMTPVRGIAWHPWDGSLLAIGGGVGNACLTIWNVTSLQEKGNKLPKEKNALAVDTLAWNPLTGELAVSYWHLRQSNGGNTQKSSISVLANLTTEVDAIEWHNGRVLYLLWGNGGTTLATAGTDENLCMWDFFGTSPDTLKKYVQKPKSNNVMLETAKIFGQCIR